MPHPVGEVYDIFGRLTLVRLTFEQASGIRLLFGITAEEAASPRSSIRYGKPKFILHPALADYLLDELRMGHPWKGKPIHFRPEFRAWLTWLLEGIKPRRVRCVMRMASRRRPRPAPHRWPVAPPTKRYKGWRWDRAQPEPFRTFAEMELDLLTQVAAQAEITGL